MRYALIFILLATLSCHSLNNSGRHLSSLSKTAGSEHNLGKRQLNQLFFHSDLKTRIPAQQELLSYIEKQKNLIVTKSILIDKNNNPECIMDVYGDKNLVPNFAKVSPKKVKSNLSVKGDLTPCRVNEVQSVKKVAKNAYVEGDKLSLLPVAVGVGFSVCLSGFLIGTVGAAGVKGFVAQANLSKEIKEDNDTYYGKRQKSKDESELKGKVQSFLKEHSKGVEKWGPYATPALAAVTSFGSRLGVASSPIAFFCSVGGYKSVLFIMENDPKEYLPFLD